MHLQDPAGTSGADIEANWGDVGSPLAGPGHAFVYQRTTSAGRQAASFTQLTNQPRVRAPYSTHFPVRYESLRVYAKRTHSPRGRWSQMLHVRRRRSPPSRASSEKRFINNLVTCKEQTESRSRGRLALKDAKDHLQEPS